MTFEQINSVLALKATDPKTLMNYVEFKQRCAEFAKDHGKMDESFFFERQSEEAHMILDFIMGMGVQKITNITLQQYNMKMLTMDASKIVETVDAQQKIQFEFNRAGHAEKVNIILNNPAIRAARKVFDKNVEIACIEKDITAEDLFAPKDNNVKIIKNQLLSYLGSGRRNEAVRYLTDIVMKHKNYTDHQSHELINSLKERFNVKEPRLTLTYTIKDRAQRSYNPINVEEWIFANYGRDKFAYVIANKQDDNLRNYHGEVVCTIDDVVKWRPALKAEIRDVIPQTKPLKKG
jgi:hypothetical protein